MSDSLMPDKPDLLATFNATYDKIATKGYKHTFAKEDPCASIVSAKRIGSVAAWSREAGVRELAVIDNVGLAHPFAKVNGKECVEIINGLTQEDMEKTLLAVGRRIQLTTPSTGEKSMIHYSSSGEPQHVWK